MVVRGRTIRILGRCRATIIISISINNSNNNNIPASASLQQTSRTLLPTLPTPLMTKKNTLRGGRGGERTLVGAE